MFTIHIASLYTVKVNAMYAGLVQVDVPFKSCMVQLQRYNVYQKFSFSLCSKNLLQFKFNFSVFLTSMFLKALYQ